MWIQTPLWCADISAHPQRADLMHVGFFTQRDAEAFIKLFDRFVADDDYQQRRAIIYGKTPGITGESIEQPAPYTIVTRRIYMNVLMFTIMDTMQYEDMLGTSRQWITDRGKRYEQHCRHLTHVRTCGLELHSKAWDAYEHQTSLGQPKPVYTPEDVREHL